ncbi:glycosyltransferase family 2 protein [Zymomonas mobilis]|uniref:UTP-glucose-1-phosphate uridylyltransferase n=1 Tax=Zymomonas mobilis subsp. pomaceae (strain ATCC 29192 / DSM 22645 / JCM 10191 / CCUG 17912 / NBRC 13757 / NCIMB 11200 / NRRL B-4491 / Barker I) TaxID=579138 RepID=F8ETE1_ZYMMT|nr:glycosyltransferase family 2 protein [Zymomonas mobilis]AEI37966.1 UTP-glucose-1-phosphate uridylyltransferase [Zymomonas mobilis subsp. pomaceae ATCC 29192]MDX5949334.1 glycosyltransferase family 2 protein [Zymomonas mobilis subsp. pomaceae]GEB89935.1 hypothetical protein ZMO02_15720 [Zymomonas mobilis subsp. pomaceae]
MKILIPIAGETPFFPEEDFPFPKPLIEVGGKPLIQWAIESLSELAENIEFIFVVLRQEAVKFSYESIFSLLTNGQSKTVMLPDRTAGALCSCLMAIEYINLDEPLIIANYDQIIDEELKNLLSSFYRKKADAGVLTFNSTHPRWSYVRTENENVVEASEKNVISRKAIAGIYWFARGEDFIEAAKNTIRSGDMAKGKYYIAPCLNQLILKNKKVVAEAMQDVSHLHSFYLPSGLEAFERYLNLQSITSKNDTDTSNYINIVIPAAGKGSRFQEAGYKAPKPFIDVLGSSMIEYVLDNIEIKNGHFTILLQQDHVGNYPEAEAKLYQKKARIVPVDGITEGTACTVLLARSHFDDHHPLLIANSDQFVEFNCQDFVDDMQARNLDGSILVFRNKKRDPKWSFARLNEEGLVVEVAEKKPISDLATVGIYLFAKGSEFTRSAIDMIANNIRVNNEFYTCPVYNYMIKNGARIGVYEIPEDAMFGLGTPQDLEFFLERKAGAGTRSTSAPD